MVLRFILEREEVGRAKDTSGFLIESLGGRVLNEMARPGSVGWVRVRKCPIWTW